MFKQRKLLCLLVIFAVSMSLFSGVVFVSAEDTVTPAPTPVAEINGFVFAPSSAGQVGSYITFTEIGYPTAVKFQVFSGNTPITAITYLGVKTLIFPKVNVGDVLAVKLLAIDGTLVILKMVTLANPLTETTPTATPITTPAPTPTYSAIKAFITPAQFGSKISVTAPGFPAASKFKLYVGTLAISDISVLGTSTDAYPAQKAGDTVNVVLFSADGVTQITSHEVTLIDPNAIPPTATPTVTPTATPTKKPTPTIRPITIKVNNVAIKFTYKPVVYYKVITAGTAKLVKALGGKYVYNSRTKAITITKGKIKITLKINSKIAYVNGKRYTMPVIAKLYKYTAVPVSFIANKLGYHYLYTSKTRTVTIKK